MCSSATSFAQEHPPNRAGEFDAPANELGEPDFPKTYGHLDAGHNAFTRAESLRREVIGQQIGLVEGVLDAQFVSFPPPIPVPPAAYRYGPRRAYRRGVRESIRQRYLAAPFVPLPFVPLPLPHVPVPHVAVPPLPLPGVIYGRPYVERVEQPLGHKVIGIGPNGYIYGPVYESDLEQQGPTLAPPRGEPGPEPIPAPEPIDKGPTLVPQQPIEGGPEAL